jgi:hypothetical protein
METRMKSQAEGAMVTRSDVAMGAAESVGRADLGCADFRSADAAQRSRVETPPTHEACAQASFRFAKEARGSRRRDRRAVSRRASPQA